MLRGAYAAASGMITRSKQIDVIGNNISNADTTGFKSDSLSSVSFDKELIYNKLTDSQVGETAAGVVAGEVTTDKTSGTLNQTGIGTDLALATDGFFAVQGSAGVEYTRNGNFEVDDSGYLALPTGQRLLTQNGALHVGSDDFSVASDGTVTQNGGTLGKIAVYDSATGQKNADGLFSLGNAKTVSGVIMQGYEESSNVDLVEQMTDLMAASRSYQSCVQAFNISGDTEQLAIEKVGALS